MKPQKSQLEMSPGRNQFSLTGAACKTSGAAPGKQIPSSCCGQMERRDFLRFVGLGAAAGLTAQMPVMAGPFEAADFEKLVPADKKLDPAWVEVALRPRRADRLSRARNWRRSACPSAASAPGQLYLGGDGRLWHWDIFNQHIGTGDEHYAQPPKPASPLEQGFAHPHHGRRQDDEFGALDRAGFSDITFSRRVSDRPRSSTAIRQRRSTVSLEAFSPFVPLERRRFEPARDGHAIHGEEHRPARRSRRELGRLAAERGLPAQRRRRRRAAAQPRSRGKPGIAAARIAAVAASRQPRKPPPRPDIVFEDFQKETYEGWEVTGDGVRQRADPEDRRSRPTRATSASKGPRVVNSHASAPGDDVAAKDSHDRHAHQQAVHDRAELHQLLDRRRQPSGQDLRQSAGRRQGRSASATGHDNNRMRRDAVRRARTAGQDGAAADRRQGDRRLGQHRRRPRSSSATSRRSRAKLAGAARLRHDGAGAAGAGRRRPRRRGGRPRQAARSRLRRRRRDRRPSSRSDSKLIGALGRKLSLEPGRGGDRHVRRRLALPQPAS